MGSCADPGIFTRGGGGSRPDGQKTAWTTFYYFFTPQLNLQFTEEVQWFYYRLKYTFPRAQRGSNIFQGGPTFFSGWGGGVQMLISIETHITCDFPGGPDPLSTASGSAHWIELKVVL